MVPIASGDGNASRLHSVHGKSLGLQKTLALMSTSTQSSMRKDARMATRVSPYLRFDGNCADAMKFYKSCFGGDLSMMTIAESPMAGQLQGKNPQHVFHASLTSGSIELLGSDMAPKEGLMKGNATV